jgi:predicted small lipoprotein YifL
MEMTLMMKNIATVLAALALAGLVGCGSKNKQPTTPPPAEPAATESTGAGEAEPRSTEEDSPADEASDEDDAEANPCGN